MFQGKTLSVLSLILTNFHDERPLGRPVAGHSRAKNRTGSVIRYMPVALGCNAGGAGAGPKGRKRGAKKGEQRTSFKDFFIVAPSPPMNILRAGTSNGDSRPPIAFAF